MNITPSFLQGTGGLSNPPVQPTPMPTATRLANPAYMQPPTPTTDAPTSRPMPTAIPATQLGPMTHPGFGATGVKKPLAPTPRPPAYRVSGPQSRPMPNLSQRAQSRLAQLNPRGYRNFLQMRPAPQQQQIMPSMPIADGPPPRQFSPYQIQQIRNFLGRR